MRKELISLALGMLSLTAQAGSGWDGIIAIPGYAIPGEEDSFLVCNPFAQFHYEPGTPLERAVCTGGNRPSDVLPPTRMTLQQAINTHVVVYRRGMRAVPHSAPTQTTGRARGTWELGVFYKLESMTPGG